MQILVQIEKMDQDCLKRWLSVRIQADSGAVCLWSESKKEQPSPGGQWAEAPEMDLQLVAETTRIQAEQTPAPFHLTL